MRTETFLTREHHEARIAEICLLARELRKDGRSHREAIEAARRLVDTPPPSPTEAVHDARVDRWIVRAHTPGGHRWVVGQAWTVDGALGLVAGVPASDAVRLELWAGQERQHEA